jgi:hypothetical protein
MVDDLISYLIIFVGGAAFLALRVWLGFIIAKAAQRRVAGFGGWIVASLLVGPLITCVVYLVCVHGRPIVFDD